MQPLLIYDGRCGFCRIWIDYWKRLTGDRIEYAPSQEVGGRFPQIPEAAFAEAVQLVRPDGSVASGARAVFETLGRERVYESWPRVARLSEAAYRWIAQHRSFFYWVTRLTLGTRIEPARFALTQWLFLRLLAAIYIVAFASLAAQVTGLIGEHGISQAHDFSDADFSGWPGKPDTTRAAAHGVEVAFLPQIVNHLHQVVVRNSVGARDLGY